MVMLSPGSCRAIDVEANPIFLFFLSAVSAGSASPSFPTAPCPGQAAGCFTGICPLPPPRDLGMLCPCLTAAWMGLLLLL